MTVQIFILFIYFLIINIALSLCYLVATSWLTRRFVTSRQKLPSNKMAFSFFQVDTSRLSQYRIQLNYKHQWLEDIHIIIIRYTDNDYKKMKL